MEDTDYCIKCGTKLTLGEITCRKCGATNWGFVGGTFAALLIAGAVLLWGIKTETVILKYTLISIGAIGILFFGYLFFDWFVTGLKNIKKYKSYLSKQQKKKNEADLITAALNGNLPELKKIIKAGVDVNQAKNAQNATALFIASHQGNIEIVNYLLENKADPNIKIKLGATPLFVAVQGNPNIEIVENLLKAGADPNIQDHEGSTPLILTASGSGDPKTAQLLIENKGKVNYANNNNITALYFAAQNGYKEFAEILIAAGADTDIARNQDITPLYIASQVGNYDLVKLLLKAGADKSIAVKSIAVNGNVTPQEIASQNGHSEIAALLSDKSNIQNVSAKKVREEKTPTDKNIDLETLITNNLNDQLAKIVPKLSLEKINAKFKTGYTPLTLAAAEGNEGAVNILLRAGADTNLEDPLEWSVYDNHIKIASALIKHKAVANAEHIYQAVGRGYTEMVKLLHENGLSIDLPFLEDKPDTSLLLKCTSALEEHIDTLNYLLEQGADVNKKDSLGRTPLHWAASRKHHKIVDALIKHGADPSITDDSGARPTGVVPEPELILAINDGNVDRVKELLESGANPNETGEEGIPPLFIVAKKYDIDPLIASLLIEHGADLDSTLKYSHSPLHLAANINNAEVVKLLINAGADINSYGENRETPLFNAAKSFEATQILLEAGADHTIAGSWGCCDPLEESINGRDNNVIKALLSAGATIGLDHIEAVLSMTIGINETIYIERLKIFASYGVDYNNIDGKGKTAYDYLRQKGEPQDWTEWTCSIVSQL